MHVVGGIAVDLNWFLQLILTVFLIAFALLYLVKNAATKYFEVDANFEGTDHRNHHQHHDVMSSSTDASNDMSCAVCGNPGSKKCSRCKSVRYCSSKCQTTHWRYGHKTKCKDHAKVNSMQTVRTGFGSKASGVGGKSFSRIALVPTHGTSTKVIKKPRKVLFPYDEFVKLFNWDKPGTPPCGLLNCGNSCFANVVLQCLAYTKPLVAYLLEKGHRKECRRDDWCFLCEFQTHVEKASQSLHPFSPMSILSRLPNIGGNLGYGRQEDAHEFMRFAIDTMQSICFDEFGGEKAVHPSTQETTLIQHIFGGHLQSQVMCTKCGNISNQYENMMDLTVEIHGDAASLAECLDQFTVKEWLHGDNMYKCDGCNDYVKAWKRLTVRRAPNILTIALKRFQSGRFGKLNKRVSFPETLDLSPYMSEEGDATEIYQLYAVVVHVDMLNASFFGHYICYIKDFRGNWYRVDDCKVAGVELEEVLSQGAYMLLYSRVSPRSSCLANNEPSKEEKHNTENVEIEPSSKGVECSSTSESINPSSMSVTPANDDSSHLRVSSCEIESITAIDSQPVTVQFEDTNVGNIGSSSFVSKEASSHENQSSLGFKSEAFRIYPEDVDMVNAQSSSCDLQDWSGCNRKLCVESGGGGEDQEDMNIDDSERSVSVSKEISGSGNDLHIAIDTKAVVEDLEHTKMVNSETSSLAAKDVKVCGSMCSCPCEKSSTGADNSKHETPFNSLDVEDGNGIAAEIPQ